MGKKGRRWGGGEEKRGKERKRKRGKEKGKGRRDTMHPSCDDKYVAITHGARAASWRNGGAKRSGFVACTVFHPHSPKP